MMTRHAVSHKPIKIVPDDPNTVSCGMTRHLSWCKLPLNKAQTFSGASTNGFMGGRDGIALQLISDRPPTVPNKLVKLAQTKDTSLLNPLVNINLI
jgi:hypothetical protein